MTIKEIRNDLLEIKYYYARQSDLDVACKTIGVNSVIDKVNKYTEAMKDATAYLIDIYVGLYVQGNTQMSLADEMELSVEYVRTQNRKLIQYLQAVLQ